MNYLFPQNFTSISLIRKYGFWNQKMRQKDYIPRD